jgi:two-component system sensor histidine kinase ArlS
MKFNYPSAYIIDGNLKVVDGEHCNLPSEYRKNKNLKLIDDFYKKILSTSEKTKKVLIGTDPLGFDYMILDYICYIGLIFIPQRDSKKNNNKKKFPENKFPKEYLERRINEEYNHRNLNRYIPIDVFSQSLHELRGLNSKISGQIENLMELTEEDSWIDRFEESSQELKKIYVGTRLTKFLLDNTRFYNPQYLETLNLDKTFNFFIHKSVFKLVKIYENSFEADRTELSFTGNTYRKLSGEREFFEIIIKILIENGIKYSTDKRIGPKITIANLGSRKVEIKVSSFGRIVPEEERQNIFKRGYRSNIHKSIRGTGIGLYIAKNLCKLYSISLTYEVESSNLSGGANIGWNCFKLVCNDTFEN